MTLKKAGYYKLEVWGAQGGNGKDLASHDPYVSSGGYGGYSVGIIQKNANDVLYIVVGEKGENASTYNVNNPATSVSYNGGGAGYGRESYASAGAGGGATHISTYNCGELKNCSSYKSNILIVVGGGGGGSAASQSITNIASSGGGYIGSSGGTAVDQDNPSQTVYGGGGGTQTAGGARGYLASGEYVCSGAHSQEGNPGSFGMGGQGPNPNCGFYSSGYSGGGGGGGWYGGGSGGYNHGGVEAGSNGGGGSGYIGNTLLVSAKSVTKQMYMYNSSCSSSSAATTKTTCTSSTGAHVANRANTGNGYARITYLGT